MTRILATILCALSLTACGTSAEVARPKPPLIIVGTTTTTIAVPPTRATTPSTVPLVLLGKLQADIVRWVAPTTTVPVPRKVTIRRPPVTSAAGCWQHLYSAAGWPPHTHAWLTATIKGESGCRPNAYNRAPCNRDGSHAIGLTQLCWPLHSWLGGNPYDAFDNLRMAWKLCLVQPTAWSWHGRCR